MTWLPASKLMTPSPIEVLPLLLRLGVLETATGGVTCGFIVGKAPKVSVNLTTPVGQPRKDGDWQTVVLLVALTTSARTNTTLPNGKGLVSGLPLEGSLASRVKVVVLLSGVTLTKTPGDESLGANLPSPA